MNVQELVQALELFNMGADVVIAAESSVRADRRLIFKPTDVHLDTKNHEVVILATDYA